MPIQINDAAALRQFIVTRGISPSTAEGEKKLDNDGTNQISLAEIQAYYAADQVSINVDAWKEVAGEDELLSQGECTAIAEEEDAAAVAEGEVATPVIIDAAALRRKYMVATETPRSMLPKQEVERKIKEALLDDGKIDKQEFEDIFGIDMKDAAWKAFAGLKSVEDGLDLETLYSRLETFEEFSAATRLIWQYFIDCSVINIIPNGQTLAGVFRAMSEDEQLKFIRGFKEDQLQRYAEMEENQILELLNKASDREIRIFMQRIFYSMHMGMREEELEMPDMTDPLVAQRFAQTCFKNYMLTEELPTQVELDGIEELGKTVKSLRRLFGDEELSEIDAGASKFNEVFDQISEVLDNDKLSTEEKKTQIRALLAGIWPVAVPDSAPEKP